MDRRHSGDTSFSNRFATVHRAPLQPEGGKIRMRIFVDSCSVEIFGNDGSAVISDLIFPPAENSSLTFYAHGGDVNLNALDIWRLKRTV